MNTKMAAQLRELAAAMDKGIAQRLRPRLENTRRRAAMAASMREDRLFMEKVRDRLLALAEAHDKGTVPAVVQGLVTRAVVEDVLRHERYYASERLARAGIADAATYAAARETLLKMGNAQAGEKTAADVLQDLIRELIGLKIAGFYPTPAQLVALMLDYADVQPGDRVLEPSAGTGNIADAIRERHPAAALDVVECHNRLRNILSAKGHRLAGADFLEFVPQGGGYNVIVMNPPFERFQDIHHVLHAWGCLEPGGRLVSIMSEAVFFRQDKIAARFREWLDDQNAAVIELPAGAFAESGTGVKTRLVMLDKYECLPGLEVEPAPGEDVAVMVAPVQDMKEDWRGPDTDRIQWGLPGIGVDRLIVPRQLKLWE